MIKEGGRGAASPPRQVAPSRPGAPTCAPLAPVWLLAAVSSRAPTPTSLVCTPLRGAPSLPPSPHPLPSPTRVPAEPPLSPRGAPPCPALPSRGVLAALLGLSCGDAPPGGASGCGLARTHLHLRGGGHFPTPPASQPPSHPRCHPVWLSPVCPSPPGAEEWPGSPCSPGRLCSTSGRAICLLSNPSKLAPADGHQ